MKTRLQHKLSSGLFTTILLLLFLSSTYDTYCQVVSGQPITSSTTWTVPTGVTSVTVECWGAGGAGGSGNRKGLGSGGGGGGAYSKAVITVIPGNQYTVTVGLGGTTASPSDGIAGGDSWFLNTSTVLAKGGSGGIAAIGSTPGAGGAGGLASSGVGTIKYSGGTGSSGNSADTGGGGGSSAGTASNGNNGTTPTGGSAPLGGGAGGNGGSNGNGSLGTIPGGAGGGEGGRNTGGAGANGQVILTYTVSNDNCPTATNVAPTGAQTLCQGDASSQLTGSVTTSGGSGTPTLLYQWYYNTSNSNTVSGATLIGGATSQTYSPLTTAAEIGTRWYFCVGYATDNNCAQTSATQSLASNTVQITVNPSPTTSNAGSPQTICDGTGTTLGANTPTVGSGAWTVFSGPNTSTAQFSSTTNPAATFTPAGGNGNYVLRWTISNAPCTPSTSDVTITVNAQPTTSNAGSPQTICTTDSATLAANTPTVGTGAWSILSGPSTSTAQFISTTDPGTTFTPAGGIGDYVLQWTISNAPCTPSSSTVTITVKDVPALPTITGPSTVSEGVQYVYSITAVPDATNYTWTVPGNPGGWGPISGQGTNSITVTSGTQGGDITVYVTNSCGDGPTASLTVTVTVASDCPTSTSVSPSGPLSECQDVAASQLTATVTTSGGSGTPTLLYQWYYNTSNSNTIGTSTIISGATASTHTPPTDVTTLGDRWYFCVGYATDNGCNQTNADQSLASNAVQVTVNPPAPAQPGAISGLSSVPESTSGLTYSVTAVPNATFYTWSVPAGWTINSGQNTNSISVTSGAAGQNGSISVYAGNTCDNSLPTTLAVISEAINCPTSTTIAPTAFQNLCVGDPATLLTATIVSSGGSGTPTIQYQWYYNTSNSNNIGSATILAGATSQTYTPDTSSSAAGNRYYFCVGYASDNGCGQSNTIQSLASNQVRVLVTPIPDTPGAISGQPDTTPSTSGYIYSISAVPYATSYNWTVPTPTGWVINSGQGTTSISVTSGAEGENGNITVTASNSCGTSLLPSILAVTSSVAASPPTITLGAIAQICKGTTTANLPYTATTDNPDQYSITFNSTALAAGFSNVVDAALPVSPIPITVPAAAPKAKYYGTLKVKNATTGYSSIGYSIVIDVNEIPPTPIVNGNATVPQNSTGFKYSASASGATSYTWSVPSGFTITAGQGTSQITVSTGPAQAAADITVTATNTCGTTSVPGSKTVVISVATNHTYYNCSSCHITHSAPGMSLTNVSGNDNLCQSCHTSTGAASAKPLTAADNINTFPATGDSHAWNVNAVNASKETNLPSNSQMALRVISGQIICSTCHDQHNTSVASPHLRASNVGDAMCKDCHSARNVGIYSDAPSTNKGSHPVGVIYNGGDSRFNAAPTNTQLVNSKVECSSCHGVHDVTGTLGLAANSNLLRTTNNASLCTDCHTYSTHNGMDCLDCHQPHNTNKGNIYMVRNTITTPNSGNKTVVFTAETSTNSFADGNATYDGVCEVCHTTTTHFQNNGGAADQTHTSQGAGIPGQNCTVCHPHSSNFSPSGGGCTSCHESTAPTFLSAVHVTHKDKYACATCHFGHGSGGASEPSHPSGTINIVFDPNGMAKRNGLDPNTPAWNGSTCSNIYCHSTGTTANRFVEGIATWRPTQTPIPITYATTPSWDTGSITQCNACHEGPATMPLGPNYTVVEGNNQGLVTASSQYPNTGAHGSNTGAHNSPDQLIILTENANYGNALNHSWPFVQCFWCHNNDSGAASGVPKKQGTYGTAKHVDGKTWFYPFWYGYGGGCEKTSGGQAPAYYLMDTESECNALGSGYVWHPAPADPEKGPSMIPGLAYSWVGPSNKHCGNGKKCW